MAHCCPFPGRTQLSVLQICPPIVPCSWTWTYQRSYLRGQWRLVQRFEVDLANFSDLHGDPPYPRKPARQQASIDEDIRTLRFFPDVSTHSSTLTGYCYVDTLKRKFVVQFKVTLLKTKRETTRAVRPTPGFSWSHTAAWAHHVAVALRGCLCLS